MNKLIHQTKADTFGLQTYLETVFTLVIFYYPLLLSQKHYSWIFKPNEMDLKGEKKFSDQKQKRLFQCLLHQLIKKPMKIYDIGQKNHLNGLYYVYHLL